MRPGIFIGTIPFGWPERILGVILALLLVVSGLAIGALMLGLGLIAGLVLSARVWWLRRRLRRQSPSLIEGEYQVLERHRSTPQG